MIFCEQCGNKLSDTAKFCGRCGAPVVSWQTEAQEASGGATCAQCGAPLEKDEVFCIVCGAKVGAGPAVPVQTQGQVGSDKTLKAGEPYDAKPEGEFLYDGKLIPKPRFKRFWCKQCGAPLEEGVMFCPNPNCGVSFSSSAWQAWSDGVLAKRKATFMIKPGFFKNGKYEEGELRLYRERLEWKGQEHTIFIPIDKISSVTDAGEYLRIILDSKEKYEFMLIMPLDDNGEIAEFGLAALEGKTVNENWISAINSLRNGTFAWKRF